MRIIQFQLYVLLMLYEAAETLDLQTDLGQNVTINCDLDDEDVYWILQKQSDSPSVILKSFSTTPFYFNKTLKKKYSVESKHDLIIYNVSVDELGVYYCMNTKTPPKLSPITTLYIIAHSTPSNKITAHFENHTNITVQHLPNETGQNWTPWMTFSLISGILNAVLIISVMALGLLVGNECCKKYGNCSRCHQNTDQQRAQVTRQTPDPPEPQYVAVDFSKLGKNKRTRHDNSTYAALNLPKS